MQFGLIELARELISETQKPHRRELLRLERERTIQRIDGCIEPLVDECLAARLVVLGRRANLLRHASRLYRQPGDECDDHRATVHQRKIIMDSR